jgi:hypothetical protein
MLKSGLLAGALIPVASLSNYRADAAALPALDPSDPTAKALGFVADAGKVDAAANPTYKPAQKCATCAQYQGKPGDASAACKKPDPLARQISPSVQGAEGHCPTGFLSLRWFYTSRGAAGIGWPRAQCIRRTGFLRKMIPCRSIWTAERKSNWDAGR